MNNELTLKAVNLEEFLRMQMPKRDYILSPMLPCQGISMLYAPRGLGKTFVALSISLAVASGGEIFGWRATSPKTVTYIDGEMPAITMQERLKSLSCGMMLPSHTLKNLKLVTPDLQEISIPDLSTRRGQSIIEPILQGTQFLVLDNIATLCRSGRENEAQSWQIMQAWLLDLRRRGISVLLVHHSGKSGDQRGSSAKEDILDTIVSLRRPKNYCMAEGAKLEFHFTKARGIVGDQAKPFEAHLKGEGDTLYWEVRDLLDVELDTLKTLLNKNLSIRDIGEEMNLSKSSVQRLIKKYGLQKA